MSDLDSLINSVNDELFKNKKQERKLPTKEKQEEQEETDSSEGEPVVSSDVDTPEEISQKEPEDNIVSEIPSSKESDVDNIFAEVMKDVDTEKMGLSDAEINTVSQKFNTDMQNSYMGSVQVCKSRDCKIKDICPFSSIGKYPDDQLCPVEKTVARNFATEYYKFISDRNGGAKEFHIIEVSAVNGLIECELEELRTRVAINNDGLLLENPAFSVNSTGDVYYTKTENPVYNIKDRIARRKQKLLQSLLLTPESQARFKIDFSKHDKRNTKDIIDSAEEKIKKIAENKNNSGNASDGSEQQ